MDSYAGKLAVVTGGGTGMGRELVCRLAAAGADVALCDVSQPAMAETVRLAHSAAEAAGSTAGATGNNNRHAVTLSTHVCDVSNQDQLVAFRDAVMESHDTDRVHLLFNNAGIAGGASLVAGDPADWDRTFGVCWGGVLHSIRTFLPLLLRAEEGAVVNTSSINGFWASLGPNRAHTAYSAAKFAVKGLTEALITDFRLHAPHLTAHVVMPGHIGTSIVTNTLSTDGVLDVVAVRKQVARMGLPTDDLSDADLAELVAAQDQQFRDNAPTTAAEAAAVILDGVLAGDWRILVGADAHHLDQVVRDQPWSAYDDDFVQRVVDAGHLGAILS
jgi:NAD(P)-dependent dehydrogenase (short-subunit alcohol dehydrogenase family)